MTKVAPVKRVWRAVKKPISAVGQFFWDSKANTFSSANLILVIGNVFGMVLMWDTRNMLWVFIDRQVEVLPDLGWYFLEIVGYLLAVNTPYLSKRIGTRHDRYPTYEEPDYDPVVIARERE